MTDVAQDINGQNQGLLF